MKSIIKKYCLDCNRIISSKAKRCKNCYFSSRKGSVPWNKGTKGIVKAWWKDRGLSYLKNTGRTQFKKGQNLNEKHFLWKGSNVKYRSLHTWVERHLGRPNICENCNKSGLSGHKIHWANKSREYKRDLKDWIRLCASCHMKYDGTAGIIWMKRRMSL